MNRIVGDSKKNTNNTVQVNTVFTDYLFTLYSWRESKSLAKLSNNSKIPLLWPFDR